MFSHDHLLNKGVNGFRNHNNHIVLTPISKVAKEPSRITVAYTEPTPNFPAEAGYHQCRLNADGVILKGGEVPTGFGYG